MECHIYYTLIHRVISTSPYCPTQLYYVGQRDVLWNIPHLRTVPMYYMRQWNVLRNPMYAHTRSYPTCPYCPTVLRGTVGSPTCMYTRTLSYPTCPYCPTVLRRTVGRPTCMYTRTLSYPTCTYCPTVLRGTVGRPMESHVHSSHCTTWSYEWSQLAICREYSSRDRFYLFVSTKASLNFSSCSSGTGTL